MFFGLLDGIVIHFHLLGEILFEPFVLLDIVIDELDGHLTVYLNGCLSSLAVVEPGFRPPSDTRTVWVNADKTGDVKALHVEVQLCKGIDQVTAGNRYVFGFFFSRVLSDDRNI